jgi:hypothetical protein
MRKLPPLKTHKRVSIITQDGEKVRGTISGCVRLQESGHKNKQFVLERIRFDNFPGYPKTLFRIGYFMLGKKTRMRNKWVWGQYAPLFKKGDLIRFISKAKGEGLL